MEGSRIRSTPPAPDDAGSDRVTTVRGIEATHRDHHALVTQYDLRDPGANMPMPYSDSLRCLR